MHGLFTKLQPDIIKNRKASSNDAVLRRHVVLRRRFNGFDPLTVEARCGKACFHHLDRDRFLSGMEQVTAGLTPVT
jgi:hypothetical protein